ncbi:MAG: ThuA domain-containing protein [Sedimentisphaerales bacterium]|nr:ThuA domain-containing protein [Sedimentisphaerales bacterium]
MKTGWKIALLTALMFAWFGALAGCTLAVTEPEIQKIKQAMPDKPIIKPQKPRKLLVFSLCQGFKHGSIPYWDEALKIMGEKTGAFEVTVSMDLNILKAETLNQFDAICFNNTTGLKLSTKDTPELCQGLMDFVKGGKGIVGIHAATDNFNQWPDMQEVMGGKFTGHPWGGGGTWAVKIDEPGHPLTQMFRGKGFKINDEIYRTDPPLYSRAKQRVLVSLDLSDPATAGADGLKPTDADTGITWIKTVGKGRLFYCSLGHNNHLTWMPELLQHYLAGIQFAMGDLPCDAKPIRASQPQPNPN